MVGAWYLLPDDGDSGDRNTPARTVSTGDTAEQKKPPEEPEPTLPPMECPADLTNCEVATGRVIYVEAVDPDGDGDAHFVTLSNQSITSTAITVFDVRTDLRPDPLPKRGDLVGGYGPVFEGSYGQRQIEVIEFHVGK